MPRIVPVYPEANESHSHSRIACRSAIIWPLSLGLNPPELSQSQLHFSKKPKSGMGLSQCARIFRRRRRCAYLISEMYVCEQVGRGKSCNPQTTH